MTREAAYSGFLPLVRMFFFENNMRCWARDPLHKTKKRCWPTKYLCAADVTSYALLLSASHGKS